MFNRRKFMGLLSGFPAMGKLAKPETMDLPMPDRELLTGMVGPLLPLSDYKLTWPAKTYNMYFNAPERFITDDGRWTFPRHKDIVIKPYAGPLVVYSTGSYRAWEDGIWGLSVTGKTGYQG